MKPISERVATEGFLSTPLDHVVQCKGRKSGDASNYNESKKYVIIDGKLLKCQMVKVEGNLIKTYTKYLQCAIVLDRSNGSKWKPQNEVVKAQSKKNLTAPLTRCNKPLRDVFSMKNEKEMQHFFPGSKPYICHSPTLANGEMIYTHVPLL